ncbi:hypothetical protein GmHk_06G017038 [Glycine max]|nr:hypothetical protein GmHk_06G017038 [Glycine max]
MLTLLAEPTPQQLTGHCRAYILWFIGGMLMPHKSRNRVHQMYLSLLADLIGLTDKLGFDMFSTSVQRMCRTIYLSSKKMGGCTLLGHGIACRSFNQGSSANRHIHWQIGKPKIPTQTKLIFQ